MKILKPIIISFVLSILLFFSACFTQFIYITWITARPYDMDIGFPFIFYNAYQIEVGQIVRGTNGIYLLYDALIFFIVTLVAVVLYRRRQES